jgi:glycosyltransferase involved in cell wall biosynthesis
VETEVRTRSGSGARVSVIIPVYGTAHFVAEALDSVLAQTHGDYEIIVVNDGSPDSRLLDEVLEPYRDRITYIVQENRGSSGARNVAVKSSRAQYVAMLDSDDRWHPEYIASQLAVLDADSTVDVVYPDAVRFTAERIGTTRHSDTYPGGGEISFFRVLTGECRIYGGATARRETLLQVGLYDEDLRTGEDLDLWLRILKAGGRIAYNDRVLAYYRIREGSLTSNEARLAENMLKLLDKLVTKLELTVEERRLVDRQRAAVAAKLSLAEGRQAFIEGDPQTAIAKLTAAAQHTKSWKLRAVIAILRIAPGMLLWLYRMRGQLERQRGDSRNLPA